MYLTSMMMMYQLHLLALIVLLTSKRQKNNTMMKRNLKECRHNTITNNPVLHVPFLTFKVSSMVDIHLDSGSSEST